MSSVETGQMPAVETGQMSAAETRKMFAAETRQMLESQIRGRASQQPWGLQPKSWPTKVPVGAKNIKFGPEWVQNRQFGLKLGPNES